MKFSLRNILSKVKGLDSIGLSGGNGGNPVSAQFSSVPRSKRTDQFMHSLELINGTSARTGMIALYRFMRNCVPSLNAAVWTWVRLAAADLSYDIYDKSGEKQDSDDIRGTVDSLLRRLYDNRYQRFGGTDALLIEFFNTLFTTGSVCGELLLNESGNGVRQFYFIDPATISFELDRNSEWHIYQEVDDRKIDLDKPSTYFYGLDADTTDPWGRSLLTSVPFVARVEQALMSDMHKSMHNAGYHRIHVSITPPEMVPGEDRDLYVSRANSYFDETVRMMKDFEPEDNPVTWDDVKIEYIGPASKISSSSSWYLNHKAVIEEICAGTHLAPFMIGYSYGSTQTWAEFNFELMQRQLRTFQNAATGFLDWIVSIEFALRGIESRCRFRFENPISVGLLDRRRAESIEIDNVIKQLDSGLITRDDAIRRLSAVE